MVPTEVTAALTAVSRAFADPAGEPTVPVDRPAEADGDGRAPAREARGDRAGRRD